MSSRPSDSDPMPTLDYAPSSVPPSTRGQRWAWMLYDWANSGYGLVWAAIFPQVFIAEMLPEQPTWDRRLMDGELEVVTGLDLLGQQVPGSSVFALLVAAVAVLTVLCSPVLGALADVRGWQKRLFVATAVVGATLAMSAALIPSGPGEGWPWAAALYLLSFFAFGLSITFYNAYLPVLTTEDRQGRLSGWGFALGYIGGAIALVIAGLGLPPLLSGLMNAQATFHMGLAFSGLWWLVFSLPAFVLLPQVAPSGTVDPAHAGLVGPFRRVAGTLRDIRRYPMLFLFLLAFLVYINGVESVITLASAFAVDVLAMDTAELTVMYLIVQVVAFAGAAAAGYAADRFGNKTVIVLALLLWCGGVGLTYFVRTPTQFTLLGVIIGLVLGGVQSSSRTLMSKLTPAAIRNEAFGFYAIGTKAVSIFGPLLFAALGTMAGPRLAVFAVLPFLIGGLLLLLPVQEPSVRRQVRSG